MHYYHTKSLFPLVNASIPLIWTIICCVTCITILITLIFQFCMPSNKNDNYNKFLSMKIVSIIGCFCFSVCCIFEFPYIIMVDSVTYMTIQNYNIDTTIILIWDLGEISLYILLLLRLHYTFKHTIYELSIKIYIFISCLIITFIIVTIWERYISYLLYTNKITIKNSWKYLGTFGIVLCIIDLIISIILIILFIQRLHNVTLNQFNEDEISISLTSDINCNLLNPKQIKLINLMVKQSIISFVMIITSNIYLNLLLLNRYSFLVYNKRIKFYETIFFMATIMRTLDCVINNTFIYLSFKINETMYYKICGICHYECKKYCDKSANNKIRRISTLKLENNYALSVS